MTRIFTKAAVVGSLFALSALSAAAEQKSLLDDRKPVITRVAVSADQTMMIIEGRDFGSNPSVILGDSALAGVHVDPTGRQITASLPALRPGTYRLKVDTRNHDTTFDVAVI